MKITIKEAIEIIETSKRNCDPLLIKGMEKAIESLKCFELVEEE